MRKQIHDNPIDHGRACALSHGTWRRVGAKLACAGACALMVGQLLLPSVALAAKWVNVGGTQYNKGAGDEAGTWSWDGADDMKLNGYNGAGDEAGTWSWDGADGHQHRNGRFLAERYRGQGRQPCHHGGGNPQRDGRTTEEQERC